MTPRPTSITVIGWILIVLGAILELDMFMLTALRNNPIMQPVVAHNLLPMSAQFVFGFLGATITMICGVALLKRQNWARFLYVGWSLAGAAFGIVTTTYSFFLLIPALVLLLIIVYYLFRPIATLYFTGNVANNNL